MSVFHYTSAGGYQSILQDRSIKPSIQGIGRPDAIAGTGIYLTDLSPHSIDATSNSSYLADQPVSELDEMKENIIDASEFEKIWAMSIAPNKPPTEIDRVAA